MNPGDPDDIPARKRALRPEMVRRILDTDPAGRAEQQHALQRRFETLPGLADAGTILLYASAFPEEFPTGPLLARVREWGKRLVCPRVDRRGRRLRLFLIDDPAQDLVPAALGIPEPAPGRPEIDPGQIDWVLVPGLAFDSSCYRLGRGAGYYDRLLPTLRPDAPRWALALDAQLVERLPVEPHDQPLDGIAGMSATILRDKTTPPAESPFFR